MSDFQACSQSPDTLVRQHDEAAARHELQTATEHWAWAVDFGPHTGPPIDDNQGPSTGNPETKKPRENPGFDALRCLPDGQTMTPTGSEQSPKTGGKTGSGGVVYPPVYPSRAISGEAEELLAIFQRLDPAERKDLLAVARGLAAKVAR